ncbi:PREDICTED: acyl-CoA:lysophosphatidylglycerol acyltransferase 1-like isoform X1 [Branchiostoma belcheri]|uniref:Acyl-CoA:lysophosphatidylglycerol acyltransferase 1-like isoform X1 n=1 Tax=Branchiostoma belcheri TaxID=7741 RepID=A0A6P4Z5J0_BRABE|nr:PREDICTED: acyl-CoA:lysophosphatidylglycerol acyltransferase 1-like isoform X1 [Branchiostoma belcheri]XP_019636740.1 PREDICTED: acyl-CoA:lysophosphatidylglycerol acyltransferase 1-like isoform X1 [Branchiostoma belcheri]
MGHGSVATRLLWLVSQTWYLLMIALRVAFVLVNNLYVVPAHFVWILCLQPVRIARPELFWELEGTMIKWMSAQIGWWGYSAGYKVYECGEDISHTYRDEAIVIVNHQSTADVATLMGALQHKGPVVKRMMWIMDYILLYTNFGLCSWVHGDFFLQQGQKYRKTMLESLKDHLNTRYFSRNHQWIVLFPEGGFLRKRRERSQKYARKNNLPFLQHVVLPRTGAMKTILDSVGPPLTPTHGAQHINGTVHTKGHVKWIVDITIGYEHGKPLDIQTLTSGWRAPYPTTLHYRHFPSSEVPRDEPGLTEWLYERFAEKEELLSHFYSTGRFPAGTARPGVRTTDEAVEITFSPWWMLSIHLFYLCSTALQWYAVSTILQRIL